MHFQAEFPVSLEDHDIPRPRFLFAKLGQVQRVLVDIVAVPAPVDAGKPSGENDAPDERGGE